MMTNLLHGAHVANKLFSTIARLRLLFVMFLTLTVSAEAWGAEYTLVTNVSDLSNGDKVIIATKNNNNPSTGVTGGTVQASTSTKKDATTSSTEADWMQFTVTTTTEGWYLSNTSSQYIGKPTDNTFYLTTATDCKGVCSVNNNGVLCCNGRYLQKNSSYYRMYSGINNSYTPFYVWKVSASYTVTATSNNNNYGTVSVSGTTITASPKTGYTYAKPAYTVTYGTAIVTQNGNTFTVSPSTNCTVRINFEAKPKYTVTLVPGSGSVTDTELEEPNAGDGVTLPTPTLSSACQSAGWSFAGWAEASVDLETTDEPTLIAAGGYEPTSNITLYAVYQRTETTSGGGGGESHSITITPNIFTDKGSNNYGSGAERIGSENAVSFGGHYITGNVKNTPSSGVTAGTYLQCQANNATIYNKTELPGKITKIVVNQYEARAFSLYCGKEQLVASNNTNTGVTPSGTKITDTSSATTMTWNVSGDYTFFAIKKGSNAGYVTSIVITYQTDGGQSETTYYHSTPECGSTQPTSYTITFNSDGGTAVESQTVDHGSKATKPANPTKTGYTFAGWYTEADTEFDFNTPIESATTLYAKWNANQYTITFLKQWGNGGTDNATVTFNSNNFSVVTIELPTRNGYTFGGYYTETGGAGLQIVDAEGKWLKNKTGYLDASGNWIKAESVSLYAKWTKIHTITWVVNNNTETPHHTSTVLDGNTIDELPNAPANDLFEDCDVNAFVGWSTDNIGLEPDPTAPTDLFKTPSEAQSKIGAINGDKKFYAVYASEVEQIVTFEANGLNGLSANGTLKWTHDNSGISLAISEGQRYTGSPKTFTITKGTSNYCEIVAPEGKSLKKAVVSITESDYKVNSVSSPWSLSTSNTTQTITTSTNATDLKMYATSSYQIRITQVDVTYTTYSNYITRCTALPDPVWGGATIDKTEIAVNCGETSSTSSAAQISFLKATNYNLYKDIAVEVTSGNFIIATSRNGEYSTSVTLTPTQSGTNIGTLDGKYVYVRAVAPPMSSDQLTGTITISGKQIATQVINVTATVTCTQYTLTLNDRGTITTAEYYAGASVPKPEDPTGVCTDPIHYVFDGWATSTVAGGSTIYTKVSFPYTMPKDDQTLYAVYRYVEEGSGDGDYHLVEEELTDYSGDYLIVSYDNNYAMSTSGEGKIGTNTYAGFEDISEYYSNKVITSNATTDTYVFTAAKTTNGYSLHCQQNDTYLGILNTSTGTGSVLRYYNEEDYNDNLSEGEWTIGIGSVSNYAHRNAEDKNGAKGQYIRWNETEQRFAIYKETSVKGIHLYKKGAGATLYTTSPVCGPHVEITSDKDIYVTSGLGAHSTVVAQKKITFAATRLKPSAGGVAPSIKVPAADITIDGTPTKKVSIAITQNLTLQTDGETYAGTGEITVSYTPTASNIYEDINVQLRAEHNTGSDVSLDAFTVHARSLPSEFVIVAKQGEKWYALNGDMNTNAANPANGQVTLDNDANPTEATYAPCNTIYTFDGLPNTGDRTYVRFQGTDGAWLWASSGTNVGIQNNVLKTTPEGNNNAYNWKLYTEDNITYRFGNANSSRQLTLSGEKFGMYASGIQDIRILPYDEKCLYNYAPTNLKVSVLKGSYVTLTWDAVAGATRYQYSTDATNWTDCGTEPTATINGLTEGTKYTYYIRAYHEDAGVSQECIDYAEITFTTANCDDVPTDITYSADLNSITVSWTAAAPNATITYNTKEDGTGGGGTINNATSPYTISAGLNPNTTYYIQILAGGTCASPIIPVKTEDVEVDIVEWQPQGIIVDINTDETVGVTLENEVSYGSGSGSLAEDLFFSKYFEGSGSLKLLAIYNGTGKDVDLSTYCIKRGSNGDATNVSKTYDLSQLGIIKKGQEIIFYSWPLPASGDKAAEYSYECSRSFLESKANESGVDANPRWILCDTKTHNDIAFEAMDFSGDDPLLLYKGNILIDVFGVSTAAERPSNKEICDGRSDNCWSAIGVSNMDYGKTETDFENGIIPEGVDVLNPTITAYTARVIMFRKNTVVSGEDAVTKNETDFVTFADEWEARQVCMSGDDGDLTCAAYQELGTFDYSDYYTKYESMGEGTTFEENDRNPDGTVTIPITDLYKRACSNIRVKLSNEDGEVLSDREYKVPIMITTTQGTDGQAFLALRENLATVEVDSEGNPTGNKTNLTLEQVREICKTCDVVVRDNAILTKAADDAADDHPEVHDIYVYENSSLIVPNGTNYTINNLSLRRNQDAVASVSTHPDALKLPESAAAPITLDFRLSAESWHWFTLPYDCNISEVTWADGTPAQYNTDWYLMTYDGEKRAETQAGGCWKAYTGTIIKAGEGFILAINGNINNPKHTYELRFPMSKEVLAAEGTDKTVDVRAWGVETNIRPNHKGWNLVGNPYLAYYQRNNITNFEGLRLGQLTGPDPQTGYWEQTGDVPYVVVPVGAGWIAYEQVLASETDLLPFTAYFVQVGNDGQHNSSDELSILFDHTKLQLSATPMPASIIQRSVTEDEEPIIVGVSLTNAKGESDKTSLIIDDQFTDEYEMNADFFKWFGDYYKYYTKPVVYSLGADNGKRAFNALSEDLATQPISLGMYAAQAGNYTFTLDRRSDLSKVQEVWLYDATQDKYTNLMQDSYTFNTAKTESAGRFFLSVKMAPKVTTAVDNITANGIWATTQDNQIVINGLTKDLQLWIYDATGKLLHADHTTNYQHSYSVPTSGVYFVRVNGKTEAQTIKVVVE